MSVTLFMKLKNLMHSNLENSNQQINELQTKNTELISRL